jgi:hypothetical protein
LCGVAANWARAIKVSKNNPEKIEQPTKNRRTQKKRAIE